ncbi:spore coat protein U domain protein [mine drainage metagenome]|uniref:Spore coat protein U domain protein n=1 Tax=mine drainage metagenome TaxID=410659 RepID=A0A1J5PGJ6_9ZZZZ
MTWLAKTFLSTGLMLLALAAHATVTCGMSVADVQPIYTPGSNSNSTGSITLTCSRSANESSTTYWIGINTAHLVLTRQGGSQTLSYKVYKNASYSSQWGTTSSSGSKGTLTFNGPVASKTLTYYLRIPSSNAGQPAGLYDDMRTVTLRFSATSADLATATLQPVASIVAQCLISTPPGNLALNYTSFSATAASNSTSFAISCTKGTPYTVSLDATSGVVLGLTYQLQLSASSGTGSALPQTYAITGSIAPNQSGTCSMGSCTATATRTVLVSY